jgi:hypothetical protein
MTCKSEKVIKENRNANANALSNDAAFFNLPYQVDIFITK